MFIISRKGGIHLVHNNYVYRSNLRRQGRDFNKIYWECIYNRSSKCRGRIKSIGDELIVTNGKRFLFFFFVFSNKTYPNAIHSYIFLQYNTHSSCQCEMTDCLPFV